MEKEKEGFPITSLREINTLLKGQHPNIVTVRYAIKNCMYIILKIVLYNNLWDCSKNYVKFYFIDCVRYITSLDERPSHLSYFVRTFMQG